MASPQLKGVPGAGSQKITGRAGGNIEGNANVAKSSIVSGTLGPLEYAEKALGAMPPEKTVKEINMANRPQSRGYAPGVIQHPQSRKSAGAENRKDDSSGVGASDGGANVNARGTRVASGD